MLAAEDDDQVRRPLMRCLALAGYEVTGAENGRQAHELLAGGAFDAVSAISRCRRLEASFDRMPESL